MGKDLIQQRRGKGSTRYRSPGHRALGEAKHHSLIEGSMSGSVVDLVHSCMHSAPLAQVAYNDETHYTIATDGMRVGDVVSIGSTDAARGNTLCLRDIPEGTLICNIERIPGDGGKFVRASGTFAKVLTQSSHQVTVLLPSTKQQNFHPLCRATVGTVSGGGRPEKPFVKAGNRYHRMAVRNKIYPSVSGTSMNAVDHPFGCSRSSRKGSPTVVPKNAPPGRKVGLLRARRTGRKR